VIMWTVTAEQATTPAAAGCESSRGCAVDNAMIAGPGYDRCGVYAAEATAAGLQTVRGHLAAEAPADAT